jgi:hypothetical protein
VATAADGGGGFACDVQPVVLVATMYAIAIGVAVAWLRVRYHLMQDDVHYTYGGTASRESNPALRGASLNRLMLSPSSSHTHATGAPPHCRLLCTG